MVTESLLDRPTTRPALESLLAGASLDSYWSLPVRWRCYREHRSPIRWPRLQLPPSARPSCCHFVDDVDFRSGSRSGLRSPSLRC